SSTGTWADGVPATTSSSAAVALTRKTTTPTSSRGTGRTSAADGLGSLRYPPGGRGHERPLPPRAALVAESVSAFGQAAEEGARRVEAAPPLRCPPHAPGPPGGFRRER